MTPSGKGSFCGSCNKVVRDFSTQSDEEIAAFLVEHKGEKVCGRFSAKQLIPDVLLDISLNTIPSFLSPVKKFALAAMLVFGSSLFNMVSAKNEGVKGFSVEISVPLEEKTPVGPRFFDLSKLDSILSSRDSFLVLLRPSIDTCDADMQLAFEPPLPDPTLTITPTLYFMGPPMVSYTWDPRITFVDVEGLPVTGYTVVMGDINTPSCEEKGPKFIETQQRVEPLPIASVDESILSDDIKKQNESDEKKREARARTNEDMLDDSDFPSERKYES